MRQLIDWFDLIFDLNDEILDENTFKKKITMFFGNLIRYQSRRKTKKKM